MRLLNTTTHDLTKFHAQIPPYAILSHTWADDEVAYIDRQYLKDAAELKAYQKPFGFYIEEARHGFEWLTEAINSMFRWYQNAAVCYVYLSDFVASADSDFTTSGGRSRWFGRAWTLQELLAPKNMVFYDCHWNDIGTKVSLAATIASITGIDRKLLTGEARLNEYSVAQKMTWASLRQATRIEDMAYSLLGVRLQEEIIKTNNDQSIFAWRIGALSDQSLSRGILASLPSDFRGSGMVVRVQSRHPMPSAAYALADECLAVDLPIFQGLGQETFLGVLYCHFIDYPDTRLAILLQQVSYSPQDVPNSTSQTAPIFGSKGSDKRLHCRRVAQDTLQVVQMEALAKWPSMPLTVSPVWQSPEDPSAPKTRFPVIDVSIEREMGKSGFFLLRTSTLFTEDMTDRLFSYIFSNSIAESIGEQFILRADPGV
ncbi:hypothetical protein G647_08319 [Cladophialophora carrionii CBS 160.54]|uniref:Heterokaryon incompatibility domain-containing protein n=1 Tax=Cladophialophora carrionii CBS 160.54 TaxID=1279043 RepID=V9D057_9EURO|nr:uncharacterized protein G647_08319 [Cladophialophora carrionii CBS 160.54]ETI20285.1 hypothetical protein G647_08319 [Cladophialophora carrionii CBS 160.54]